MAANLSIGHKQPRCRNTSHGRCRGAYYHVGDMKVGVGSTGTACGDDELRMVMDGQLCCADGGIHLADAAFLKHDFVVAYLANGAG